MRASGTCWIVAVAAVACGWSGSAYAIRPFVTDDARVVGDRLAQLETWVLVDPSVVEHNMLVAVGPSPWLEVTYGLIHGGVHGGSSAAYSITGPILQLKALLLAAESNSFPGVAISGGSLVPLGHGPFTPPGWSGFGYLALTENLWEERLLLHANIGFAVADTRRAPVATVTAGLGFQVRVIAGFHAVGEVFYGDPYAPLGSAASGQLGFRYIFNDNVQIDGTFGSTFEGVATDRGGHPQTEQWGTLGLRLVTSSLF